jgi:hypothetical protein
MADPANRPAQPDRQHFLRCPKCGATQKVSQSEQLQYAQGHWPTCCNQVMALFSEADKPKPPTH